MSVAVMLCLVTVAGAEVKNASLTVSLVGSEMVKTLDQQPIISENLIGKWRRNDGDYVIEIKKIGKKGAVDASYYNPNPINIAQAKISLENSDIKLIIELRDKGYPGSIYTLYPATPDLIKGTYFHAGLGRYFRLFSTGTLRRQKNDPFIRQGADQEKCCY